MTKKFVHLDKNRRNVEYDRILAFPPQLSHSTLFSPMHIDIERSHGLHFVRNINHSVPVKCISFNIKQKVSMISSLHIQLFLSFR